MIHAGAEAREALRRAGARVLLHDPKGASRSGDTLRERVERLAGALVEEGVRGGRVGLWYANSCSAVEAFLAVEWIGGTRVPVDPNAPFAEAEAVFAAAAVDLVLTDKAHGAAIALRHLVHDDDHPLAGAPLRTEVQVDPEKALLLYPRAVAGGRLFAIPLSYANWRATMRRNIALYREGRYGPWQGEAECFFAAQQIMHATGFVGTFPFLEMGLPQVLGGAFDAESMLRAVEQHKVTATVLVTPMLTRFVEVAAQNPAAAASLRHVMYGGAPIGAGALRHAMAVLGPVLVQGYGRVEGGWPLALLDIDDHRAIAAGDDALAASCGRPLADVRVKLRPVGGAPAGGGELCVAGDAVARDYADPEGWCSLGDLMELDSRGYLRHRGRLDRMINTGYHIYPDEVEEAIAAIPGVAAARVVGEGHPEGGERLVAYLVLAPGVAADAVLAQAPAALAARLARYKIPRVFRAVAALP